MTSPASHPSVRERILTSALDSIGDFGVRRFTVDELAKRVGLSRVTIYRHFPSKDEVLSAALLHELRAFMADVEATVTPFGSAAERVTEGFVYSVMTLHRHAVLRRLLRTEPETVLPLLSIQGAPVIEIGRDSIAGYIATTPEGARMAPADLRVRAELVARLVMSLTLTPPVELRLDNEEQLRAYAERYVVPLLG